jgi:uncharacterized membrane protein YhaH (DUF805 family)
MFKSPFSFEGRIRRSEFGITFIIYVVTLVIVQGMTVGMASNSYRSSHSSDSGSSILYLIFMVPLLWFLWAQGAKRCHDLGYSGWRQIIPFYFLWLIFADGQPGLNEYGYNPKGIGNNTQFSFEQPENQPEDL